MPIVASGSTVVYMDPSKSVFNCEAMQYDLEDEENLDLINNFADFDSFKRLGDKFWKNGYTQGSLFKFSLRQYHEELSFSSICYDDNTFGKLMEKFLNEAYLALIFLKKVKSLKMYVMENGSSTLTQVFSIMAKDSAQKTKFPEVVSNRVMEKDFSSIEKLRHQIDLEQHFNGKTQNFSYVMCEHFGYSGDNVKFKEMMIDEELSYVPLVSVALPIHGEDPGGHLFSALPLPLQVKCMTGIPAHINGFFALGQDRKDLKWKTLTDATDSNDKTVKWNQCLIKEIVPLVYMDLIKFLTESYQPKEVYTAWPCKDLVDKRWHIFLKDFYNFMSSVKIIYVHPFKEYFDVAQVLFIDHQSFESDIQKGAVSQLIQLGNYKYAEVKPELTNSFNESLINWVDSAKILQILRENPLNFTQLTSAHQTMVLDFAIKSPTDWNTLCNTPILKLLNGTYVSLSSSKTCLLVKDKELIDLLPSQDNILDTSLFGDGGSGRLIDTFETWIKQGLSFLS